MYKSVHKEMTALTDFVVFVFLHKFLYIITWFSAFSRLPDKSKFHKKGINKVKTSSKLSWEKELQISYLLWKSVVFELTAVNQLCNHQLFS